MNARSTIILAALALLATHAAAATLCAVEMPLATGASVCASGSVRLVKPFSLGPFTATCIARGNITGSLRVLYPPGACGGWGLR